MLEHDLEEYQMFLYQMEHQLVSHQHCGNMPEKQLQLMHMILNYNTEKNQLPVPIILQNIYTFPHSP